MAPVLPYTSKDTKYDNAKFRKRSTLRRVVQAVRNSNVRRQCGSCGMGQILLLLLIGGLMILAWTHPNHPATNHVKKVRKNIVEGKIGTETLSQLWKKRLPPKLKTPGVQYQIGSSINTTEDSALWEKRQSKVSGAFMHAWKGYRSFALGYDELHPVTKSGVDGLGGLGATVIDALDTAMIMGLDDVVQEAGSWIQKELLDRIAAKGQVNLFETTIRVLGGLLSAYHLRGGGGSTNSRGARTVGPDPEVYLHCARDLGDRLLSAFTCSKSPVPYSDVVLRERTAHPAGTFDGDASTAEATSVQLEFSYLSHVTGDPKYEKAAMAVYEHFKGLPKTEGLVPIFIEYRTISRRKYKTGISGDSYYEYLLKVWIQHGGAAYNESAVAYLRDMYDEAMNGVKHRLVSQSQPNGLVFVGELPHGPSSALHPKMDHLVCFLAGNLALGATRGLTIKEAMEKDLLSVSDLEDLKLAEELGRTCYEMYNVTATGLAPEIAYFNTDNGNVDVEGGRADSVYKHDIRIKPADRHNLLRPETVESLFLLYRITEDSKYREWGWNIFQSFEVHTKVKTGGYSSLDDVTSVPAPMRDKMETFFLGETLKYLYLLFGDANALPLTEFVFNTEAHPLPIRSKKVEHESERAVDASANKLTDDILAKPEGDVSTGKHKEKDVPSTTKHKEKDASGTTKHKSKKMKKVPKVENVALTMRDLLV